MLRGRSFGGIGLAAVLLLLVGAGLDSAAAQPVSRTRDEQAAVSAIEAVFAAGELADFAALDSLYAGDDLTVIEGTGIDRGWADYRDHHLKPELERLQIQVYRPYEIEAHVAGEVAWAIFRYDLKLEGEDLTIDNVGRGTAILEKREGRWVVRHVQTASRTRK
jgi:ketosteroid isomerase-like protein